MKYLIISLFAMATGFVAGCVVGRVTSNKKGEQTVATEAVPEPTVSAEPDTVDVPKDVRTAYHQYSKPVQIETETVKEADVASGVGSECYRITEQAFKTENTDYRSVHLHWYDDPGRECLTDEQDLPIPDPETFIGPGFMLWFYSEDNMNTSVIYVQNDEARVKYEIERVGQL